VGERNDELVCPTCGEEIDLATFAYHLAGLDGTRPECARQDIGAIRRRRERWPDRVDTTELWASDWNTDKGGVN
jgi:hypothetical protein